MHPAAFYWVTEMVTDYGPFDSVIEIGSRDVNGSVRSLFGDIPYTGLDLYEGPSVDWVGDAAIYKPPEPVGCVVCCETLEHAPNWKQLVKAGASWLRDGGHLIVTCAGPGRKAHSAIDGSYNVRDGEHYGNVSPEELAEALPLTLLRARSCGEDTQLVARR